MKLSKTVLALGIVGILVMMPLYVNYASTVQSLKDLCGVPGTTRVKRDLKIGDIGNDVRLTQCIVFDDKPFDPEHQVVIDYGTTKPGVFDKRTETKLKAYQEKAKIPVTGIVDSDTREKINELAIFFETLEKLTVSIKDSGDQFKNQTGISSECSKNKSNAYIFVTEPDMESQMALSQIYFEPNSKLVIKWQSCNLQKSNEKIKLVFTKEKDYVLVRTDRANGGVAMIPSYTGPAKKYRYSVSTKNDGSHSVKLPKQHGLYRLSFSYKNDGKTVTEPTTLLLTVGDEPVITNEEIQE